MSLHGYFYSTTHDTFDEAREYVIAQTGRAT